MQQENKTFLHSDLYYVWDQVCYMKDLRWSYNLGIERREDLEAK